jgi:hypothetical protein
MEGAFAGDKIGLSRRELDDGAWRFTKADGRTMQSFAPDCTQPLGDWTALRESKREGGINIDADTAATGANLVARRVAGVPGAEPGTRHLRSAATT